MVASQIAAGEVVQRPFSVNDAAEAVYDMEYDTYGNVTKFTRPENIIHINFIILKSQKAGQFYTMQGINLKIRQDVSFQEKQKVKVLLVVV